MIYHIKDFIKDEGNATPAFVEAIGLMQSGDILRLGSERYDLRVEGAYEKHCYISNNDSGDKKIALPIIGKENITVEGEGAALVFHGEMLPVAVDRSKNVTLKGFSIDYEVPMYGQAEIVEATEDKTVLRFDGRQFNCRVDENGDFCFYSESGDRSWERHRRNDVLSMEFDREGRPTEGSWAYFPHPGEPEDHGFLSGMYHDVTLEELDKNLIAMHGRTGVKHTVGNTFVMTYNTREYPGIFTDNSDDVLYEDITLYHTMSMGFISQNTKNITLRRVKVEPRRDLGRLLSVSCDATHFVNCRGKIELDSCRLEYMMDDACNIHGNYHIYESKEGNVLTLCFGHHQQSGANTYRAGDTVAVIDADTMKELARATVKSAELLSAKHLRMEIEGEVPDASGNYVIENISTAPDIYIHDCVSGYNRPRGFLLSSRGKTLVERCAFHNMYGGVQFSAEVKDWYESGPADDITIRDCDFTGSAYCGGTCIHGTLNIDAANDPEFTFFGNVLIENNHFEQGGKRIMAIKFARNVTVRNNTFKRNDKYLLKDDVSESGIVIERCKNVDVEEVKEI